VATAAAVLAVASPAAAADGTAAAAGSAAETRYQDHTGHRDDIITITDTARDTHGAAGWIEVQQADGSWNKLPKIYVGGGVGSSTQVHQDVIRELARVRVVSCLQDGPGGSPYNCGIAYGGGDSY
jgi:hypothetical protein